MNVPPPLTAVPPRLPPQPQSQSLRTMLATVLSLYLVLFLTDALVSLGDDSLIAFGNVRILATIRGLLAVLALLMSVGIYGMMGLTPMIPKRLFLPLALFNPLALLVVMPFLIYRYSWLHPLGWVVSLCQVGCGLTVLYYAQGGFKLRWPLIAEARLEARRFSWRNLAAFTLVNVFVLLPAAFIYLVVCAGLAVDHFSDGFVALRPGGLMVQARTYVRDDGKSVQLFPMAHVADRSFYRELSESFTTNAIILMEGVSDESGLLTNRLSYKRMAKSLGVTEQAKEFQPTQGRVVPADVDVAQFTTNTIGFLNLTMLIHSQGLNVDSLLQMMQSTPAPGFEQELMDDLLGKRNRHLMAELRSRLSQADEFVVPWGAAHMPELARELKKLGFRLDETQDFTVIRFRSAGAQNQVAEQEKEHEPQ